MGRMLIGFIILFFAYKMGVSDNVALVFLAIPLVILGLYLFLIPLGEIIDGKK